MSMKEFQPKELDDLVHQVQAFVAEEFDLRLGRFEAESLIGFFGRALGNRCYNRGLHDAEAAFLKKMDEAVDAVVQLERHG